MFEKTRALARWLRDGPWGTEHVRRFAETSFAIADGHATERLVDEVLLPALP